MPNAQLSLLPNDGDIWRAMQRALAEAAPRRGKPTGDAPLFDGGLELASLELLAFLVAVERELELEVVNPNLPDAALLSLGALHRHLTALAFEKAAMHANANGQE